jgi:hypothetical protein
MPRKQRFKPSRKPKAIGTLTDLAPLVDQAEPSTDPIKSTGSQEVASGEIEPDVRSRESDAIPSVIIDLGGESG